MFQPKQGFPIEKRMPVKQDGRRIKQITYEGHFDRKGIQEKADKLSAALHKKGFNGSMMIMTINNDVPRNGHWTLTAIRLMSLLGMNMMGTITASTKMTLGNSASISAIVQIMPAAQMTRIMTVYGIAY